MCCTIFADNYGGFMEQITVTAKIQISADADSRALLNKTMSVYSDAPIVISTI